MNKSVIIRYFLALVWLINGLYAKLLGFVPRHQEIVGILLNVEYAEELTILIGLGELVLVIWILSKWKIRLCASVQIMLVLTMNVIELIWVKDMLLFGTWNMILAIFFCILIYVYGFVWTNKVS